MSTKSQTTLINAFVDGALDLSAQLEMEERLLVDTDLQRQVEQTREWREAIRGNADYHAAPEVLRARMATLMSGSSRGEPHSNPNEPGKKALAPRSAASNGLATTLQNWFSWRPLAASLGFAAMAAVAVNLLWLQASKEEQLSDDVVASHVRSTLGQHLVDVSSSDHHTVKPFLSSKLGFSPPVDELAVPGSSLLGGRIDYLDGKPVAALVYKQGEHVVNSFVWPGTGSDSSPSYSTVRGFRTAHWSFNGMKHWVISDVNAQEFDAVVKAVQQLDTAR
jgi:anti-sigma factor RsiW